MQSNPTDSLSTICREGGGRGPSDACGGDVQRAFEAVAELRVAHLAVTHRIHQREERCGVRESVTGERAPGEPHCRGDGEGAEAGDQSEGDDAGAQD